MNYNNLDAFALGFDNLPLEDPSDHGVSDALDLRDPDGNGVELYWDRPKETWPLGSDAPSPCSPIPSTSIPSSKKRRLRHLANLDDCEWKALPCAHRKTLDTTLEYV